MNDLLGYMVALSAGGHNIALGDPGTLRKISGIWKFGQKILSKMRARVHRKFQDPHFSHVTVLQKSGITVLAMHLRF